MANSFTVDNGPSTGHTLPSSFTFKPVVGESVAGTYAGGATYYRIREIIYQVNGDVQFNLQWMNSPPVPVAWVMGHSVDGS